MISIVGGTYQEFCHEPQRSQLYGSGGRAASALSKLSSAVKLYTYVNQELEEQLQTLSVAFGFEVESTRISQIISFAYLHSLAKPYIEPPINDIEQVVPLKINEEVVLRFGFMEGDAVVHGDRVVYDPQSPIKPIEYHKNGSTAKSLAIVANYEEALVLAKKGSTILDPLEIGQILLKEPFVEVVVIKQGSKGAVVVTELSSSVIPAYKTSNVFKIGSGDIFTAVFAHYWAELESDPFEAAKNASIATAYYCNSEILPIPRDLSTFMPEPVLIDASKSLDDREYSYDVYLAGPFFTMAERWIINETRTALVDQGLKVFSPYHDVGIGASLEVIPADIQALNQSAIVFAILDPLDTGTVFEIGYARAQNIPVVAFIQNQNKEAYKILEGTHCKIYSDYATAIYQASWEVLSR